LQGRRRVSTIASRRQDFLRKQGVTAMKIICLTMGVLLSFQVASAPEIKQDFGRLKLGTDAAITLSVIWKGDKKPENASASMFVAKGPIKDVFTFMTADQVRELHTTLGKMVAAIDGQ